MIRGDTKNKKLDILNYIRLFSFSAFLIMWLESISNLDIEISRRSIFGKNFILQVN